MSAENTKNITEPDRIASMKLTNYGQLAEQPAGVGEHVLYFSLEQTTLELVCKGLYHLMFRIDNTTALSSMDIRRDIKSEALRIARELYAAQSKHGDY